jgi:putative ABC transport system permease protein
MTVVILLFSFCYNELTTDRHQENKENGYLLINSNGEHSFGINMPGVLSYHLDSSVFEIKKTVRMASFWEQPVLKSEKSDPLKSKILFVDGDFFELFTYHPVSGDLDMALQDPKSMVITEKFASRLFGSTDVIGETIMLNNEHPLVITAIVREPGNNTFLDFEALISMEGRKIIQPNPGEFTNWNWWNFNTFILTDKDFDQQTIEEKIRNVFIDHSQSDNSFKDIGIVSLQDIYFSKIESGWQHHFRIGNKQQVIVLALVAFLILLIAIINFINISSSQYLGRLKQAGIQKILGASKFQIIQQVLFESTMLFVFSAWIGIIFTEIIQLYISQYLEIQLISGIIFSPTILFLIIGLSTIIGILSSLPTAYLISSSKSIDNLKSAFSLKANKSVLRSILVVTQFAIAIILIGFTLLVQKQIRFGISNLGYEKENIVGIKFTQQLYGKSEILKKELLDQAFINNVSMTQFFPGKDLSYWGLNAEINGESKQVGFIIFDADQAFFDMLNIKSIDGRIFSDDLSTDKNKAVVNEAFLRANNITDPIGIELFAMEDTYFEIIGIIEDFHFESVNKEIGPLLINNSGNASVCLVNMQSHDFNVLRSNMENLREICHKLSPDFPVEIRFMDQAVENMYKSEIRFRRIFTLFSSSAIFISCLGILALSIFVCNIKTKEIGIRKTFGASVRSIFNMLNREFTHSVIIAFSIACPISWYLMQQWLKGFSYQTEISWWIFAISGFIAMGIAFLSVSWQSYRSARKNPVDILRYE